MSNKLYDHDWSLTNGQKRDIPQSVTNQSCDNLPNGHTEVSRSKHRSTSSEEEQALTINFADTLPRIQEKTDLIPTYDDELVEPDEDKEEHSQKEVSTAMCDHSP